MLDNALLNTQIENYKAVINTLNNINESRLEQINNYQVQVQNLNSEIDHKNKMIKFWKIGGITVTIGLTLFLLWK